jgi:tetratricopeptide (TPR) repeat protein
MRIDGNIPQPKIPRAAVNRSANVAPKANVKPLTANMPSVNVKDSPSKGINIPQPMTRQHLQEMAAYYNKVGRTYEESQSYKMAISAYEKANTVDPNIGTAKSIESARHKEYKA